ncbi:DNA polymerase III subunit alpha [Candidatus Dependentiae bacterium]|nr:DNA polymerase III subunit alpha [Candidatus Dependentiae bacterium]
MSKEFTHLHLHTEFSLLDGAIKIPQLLDFAKMQNWKSIGISDHGNIFGAVKFFQQAKKFGIKPILGVEMYFIPDIAIKDVNQKYFHILLIVKDKIGYKNLCQLLAFAYKDGFYFKPRIDYKILKKYSEGLIIGTACLGGHIPNLILNQNFEETEKRINWFLDVFGAERFYFEVQPHNEKDQIFVNKKLLELGKKFDVNCIATCDAHYINKHDRYAHEVLLAIQTRKLMSDTDRMTFGEFDGHLKTTREVLDYFKEDEQVVWNTGKIVDQCEFQFEFGKLFFPICETPDSYTQEDYFKKLCFDGLTGLKKNRLIIEDQYENYEKRLRLEIDLIIKMGYVGYFLVVSDFIRWAKKQDIPVGPGRGSAAGSLVAWTMEITNVDPIKYNLLFERFLNPERVSMPDIDIDFCVEQREKVINYVKEKYGHDCVCQIITFGTMMAKGVIKDVARTLGFPFQDANAITELIPNQLKITLNQAVEQEPKLKEIIQNNSQVKNLFDISFKLEGLTRHASKHAAGVVISPKPLREVLPLYVPPKTNELVTQYAMTELESVGFLKMDFLGLKNLTVIQRALETIKKNYGIKIDLDKIPFDDLKSFELLCKGETSGIFQFESEGIKEVLRKLQPEKFEDLIAVNALYRPGPLGSGMVDDFIDRRHGKRKTTYMFAELEPILAETYGVIVYQEQVMKIASTIAGYTLGGADILRRAMGKKKIDVMEEQKELFIKGAKERNFDGKKAAELFDLMAYFAGYGFNKSHSTAYAMIAYQTAYLKANYPAEFMASLISFETNNPDQFAFYLQEIKDMQLNILLPDINKSKIEFCVQNNEILFGLKGIKNVGGAALENIMEQREKGLFVDLLDFCKRVDLRCVNKRVIESLVCAGAMDCLSGNRAQKMAELDKIIKMALDAKEDIKTGQMSMFSALKIEKTQESEIYSFESLSEWSDKEKLDKEKEVIGFYLSSHPLENYPIKNWIDSISFAQALEKIGSINSVKEPNVVCVGLMQNYKVITTKKGDKMAFAQFEDLSGNCEIIIFPAVYKKIDTVLDEYNVFVIKGFIDTASTEKCKIKVNKLIPIDIFFEEEKPLNIDFKLPRDFDDNFLKKLKNYIQSNSNNKFKVPYKFVFNENKQNLELDGKNKISFEKQILHNIEKLGIQIQIML